LLMNVYLKSTKIVDLSSYIKLLCKSLAPYEPYENLVIGGVSVLGFWEKFQEGV